MTIMLTLIEIDGGMYHAQQIMDEDCEIVLDTIPILDENNNLIPSEVCLCFARDPSECVCACTSWGDYKYD